MNKSEYFNSIEDVVLAPVQFDDQLDSDANIFSNMHWLSISSDLASEITVSDLVSFFNRVLQNRLNQARSASKGLLFYLWFDEIACQLRFNVISDLHKTLPFDCRLVFVEMNEIVDDFLKNKYHNGLPMSELVDLDNHEETREEFTLKVFSCYLR